MSIANTRQEILTTTIQSVNFDPQNPSFFLEAEQFKLQELYSVPRYLNTLPSGETFFLKFSEAKSMSIYRWNAHQINAWSLSRVKQVTLKPATGQSINVPLKLESRRVELDLVDVVNIIRPNIRYHIVCDKCLPAINESGIPLNSIPVIPKTSSEISLTVSQSEKAAVLKRMRQDKQAELTQERQIKLAAREREQRLALEKKEREASARRRDAELKQEANRKVREGDGSQDDLLCKKYGFRPNTQAYAGCRMQIDVAKREMQQQQAFYQAQQQQIQQAQEVERKRRQSDFLLGMGLRMMGGQSAPGAAIDQSVGAPMYQPPLPSSRTYTFPNGRMMTCTSNGSFTNCY